MALDRKNKQLGNILAILGTAVLLYGACLEFYNVAWGTGVWLGEYSLKWFILFIVFVFFCIALFLSIMFLIWMPEKFMVFSARMTVIRERIFPLRWLFAVALLVFPVWFLQYSMWGIVFQGLYIRALIWGAVVFIVAGIFTKGNSLIGWREFLAALILTGSAFSIAASLSGASNYPFSLGWSEGNRLWDYSTVFGRALYDYPVDRSIPVLSDRSRLLVGGLPFIIPNLTIGMERFWVGLTQILPYFFVGLASFSKSARNKYTWLLTILWVFLFLKQGPIYSPLVLCAALTALLWRKPLWISIPLIIYAGYAAQASRFTWMFAPGIWIGMLELSGAALLNGKLAAKHWVRAISLGFAGFFGGFLLPKIMPLFEKNMDMADIGGQFASAGNNMQTITSEVTHQPLLWYRLLPNSTYGNGILLGLLIAVGPLLIILIWLAINKKWLLNIWQKLAIFASLLAFLAVGLVASTKIGGGGDLHNMDMFLIGLMFTAVIAWFNGGRELILDGDQLPYWIKAVVILSLILPALGPWRQMRSYNYGEKSLVLVTLTDAPDEKSLELLPSQEKIDTALETIEEEISQARQKGDILFIDQRQLLTFGFVTKIPLVPEYEKKVLMNEALSSNSAYFEPFYTDLAAHRFVLIVSELLRTPVKDDSFQFGEENNAWVMWVANPILCYYDEKTTLKEVGVQLLVPKDGQLDCSEQLP